MKTAFAFLLTSLCAVSIQLAAARANTITEHQRPLDPIETMGEAQQGPNIPGHNNVTYGSVPREDQLFEIETIDIQPLPIILDQFFFVLLRGRMPKSKAMPSQAANDLTNATLSITLSATLENGNFLEPVTYTVPFRTTAFGEHGSISIRETGGPYVDYIAYDGQFDVLADCQLISMFIEPGLWTMEFGVKLEDDTCLFDLSLTQWLPGRLQS
ncbi:hypothetical protein F4808DRAFT_290814 [Astrocystis sublimbata]|nr:hypothetical protein F4808DRAFT_290814 [Astrocystis sublimbata]